MENTKEVVELTMQLQAELEKMTDKEFKAFMKGKVLKYNGQLYGLDIPKKKKEIKQ